MGNCWILDINPAIPTLRAPDVACSMALRVRIKPTISVWIRVFVSLLQAGLPDFCTLMDVPTRLERRMDVLNFALSVSQLFKLSAVQSLISDLVGNQYSWNVLQCEPGKFCCRAASDTSNCCGKNETMISTSHIGNLLLPGSTSAVNTTFNTTSETSSASNSSSSNNSTCASASSNSTLIDRSQCPADHSATVGGAVGGILGAALIGAIVALVFTLRSRKHAKANLATTQMALTTTETQAAEEKANHQKQLEEQQRHMQSMPPNYPNGHYSQHGAYPTRPPPPNEIGSNESHVYSELAGADGSRVELTSETVRGK